MRVGKRAAPGPKAMRSRSLVIKRSRGKEASLIHRGKQVYEFYNLPKGEGVQDDIY